MMPASGPIPGTPRGRRRLASGSRRRGVALLALLLLVAPLPALGASQSPEAIQEAAERFLQEKLQGEYDEVSVTARGIDTRLNLTPCKGELEAFIPHGRPPQRTSTVGVRCDGEAPWTLYVRMEVELKTRMLVAERSLRRGSRLQADDVRLALRDARRVRGTFYRTPEAIAGLEMSRSVREGTVLTDRHVQPPLLIERGDRVTILAGNEGSIQISSRGRALERGREGDRVRVENLDSGREIEGQVTGDGTIRIAY
ncbi:MAG: flagellar basal body P-ring formation chaperone FlgA [Halorhodospira sp.]